MKKRILLLFLFIAPFLGRASHIVGGEFELVHISGFQYRLNMILYFDEVNGEPGAKETSVVVSIFRMSDNARMMNVTLPLTSVTNVAYTQPSCSRGDLVTTKMVYTTTLTLAAANFDSPSGYYISWQRCCRNYQISNIYSAVPGTGSISAGQTFYLEFPPVVKDGQPFVDSTPRLFPPLNDFGSPNRPYYKDFGGTDDDGDSLVYSLAEPLNTRTTNPYPPNNLPEPRPYGPVTWRPPFSFTNILSGAPDLRISRDGFLTVTPTVQGLFVFAVKVEEYRNKIKIGETRRDFQMLVVDPPLPAVPPQILGKKLADATYTYDNVMYVDFLNSVPDGQRCIKVQVSDADSQSAPNNFIERVSIKVIPLNFKKSLTGILPSVTNAVLTNGSVAEFTLCFPMCPYFTGGDPVIGIVALDDACSLPLTDTLKVTLHVEPPLNHAPYFTSTNPVNAPLGTMHEGDPQGSWPFVVKDDDNDQLVVSLLTNGFVLATEGMTFNILSNTPGAANGEIKWDPRCDIYDFRTRTNFQLTVQVEDQDVCLLPNPVKAIYNLNVILPPNGDPNIDTDLTTNPKERTVTNLSRRIYESFNFNVTGTDPDNDYLVLSGKGKDFNLSDYGIVYPASVTGNGTVGGGFRWDLKCTTVDLKKKDSFDLQFIVVDNANKCRIYKADTVDVSVKIIAPLNLPPLVIVTNRNTASTTLYNNGITMIRGPSIELQITGTDADVNPTKDNLKLELTSATGTVPPTGYTFANISGTSPLQATFTWQPDCSIFQNGVYENDYVFTFKLSDDHCLTAKKDSVNLKIKIKDVDGSDTQFIAPNFFSPNGDNVNDYFAMEMKDAVTGEVKNILPNDNCVSVFEGVNIVNRWGTTVFQSTDRFFKWYGVGK